jgi:phosphoglycolate phosphatase
LSLPTILLFDIDGTLLNAHGAGRRALDRAFFETTGRPAAIDRVDLRGMTDPLIVEAGFRTIGLPNTPEHSAQVLSRYVSLLEQELQAVGAAITLPGVEVLLDWIERTLPRAAIGLGTGNVEAGAFAKLRCVGLDGRFCFGGFGSDHAQRSEILRAGKLRGAKRLGLPPDECRTLVFGDTVRDVEAALAIGADCVAVGTGGVGLGELAAAGAKIAVRTLEDPRTRSYLLATAGEAPY